MLDFWLNLPLILVAFSFLFIMSIILAGGGLRRLDERRERLLDKYTASVELETQRLYAEYTLVHEKRALLREMRRAQLAQEMLREGGDDA